MERRNKLRHLMRRRATIRWGGRDIPCVVWDLSDRGARISAPHVSRLPESFTLSLGVNGERVCEVVWCDSKFLGVAFVNDRVAEASSDSRRPYFGWG